MTVKEVESQQIPPSGWHQPLDTIRFPSENASHLDKIVPSSQRIHKEACCCLFPLRADAGSFGHWTKRSLQAAEQRADAERELDHLAQRWTKLRHAFNDWLDEIYRKKDNSRLERTPRCKFKAKPLKEADPFDRLLVQLLCSQEQTRSSKDYRSIRWYCVQPKPHGTSQAA